MLLPKYSRCQVNWSKAGSVTVILLAMCRCEFLKSRYATVVPMCLTCFSSDGVLKLLLYRKRNSRIKQHTYYTPASCCNSSLCYYIHLTWALKEKKNFSSFFNAEWPKCGRPVNIQTDNKCISFRSKSLGTT